MKETVVVPLRVLSDIFEQIVSCNYTCEAGHIEHNAEFQKLYRIVASVLVAQPDWSLAPDWAEWWAVDENGSAFWYDHKPVKRMSTWFFSEGECATSFELHETYPEWGDSLRSRTETEEVEPAFDWSIAPDWARWFAVDGDGNAYWYKEEPQLNRAGERWLLNNDGIMLQKVPTKYPSDNWELSLRKRTLEVSDAPDWDSAPVWAEWYAVDDGGAAYYYEEEPSMGLTMWLPMRVGARSELANDELIPTLDWKSTLQERPT